MQPGRYLTPADRKRLAGQLRRSRRRRIVKTLGYAGILAAGNGLLIYLIGTGRLEGASGAGLTAAMSAYFGYQLKGVLQ